KSPPTVQSMYRGLSSQQPRIRNKNRDYTVIGVEVDKHLRNFGPSTGFGNHRFVEIIAYGSENMRLIGLSKYRKQTTCHFTFYKAEIPAKYWIELEKGLPKNSQGWPAENGILISLNQREEGRYWKH
ncbi:9707_t:CDS:2, partial [Ambispora leptoticha]